MSFHTQCFGCCFGVMIGAHCKPQETGLCHSSSHQTDAFFVQILSGKLLGGRNSVVISALMLGDTAQ